MKLKFTALLLIFLAVVPNSTEAVRPKSEPISREVEPERVTGKRKTTAPVTHRKHRRSDATHTRKRKQGTGEWTYQKSIFTIIRWTGLILMMLGAIALIFFWINIGGPIFGIALNNVSLILVLGGLVTYIVGFLANPLNKNKNRKTGKQRRADRAESDADTSVPKYLFLEEGMAKNIDGRERKIQKNGRAADVYLKRRERYLSSGKTFRQLLRRSNRRLNLLFPPLVIIAVFVALTSSTPFIWWTLLAAAVWWYFYSVLISQKIDLLLMARDGDFD